MTALQEAEPRRAFTLGYLLILLMPTDIIAVIATVNFSRHHDFGQVHAWTLVAATVRVAGGFALIGHTCCSGGVRARRCRALREWLTSHSWLVNLIVIVYFTYHFDAFH